MAAPALGMVQLRPALRGGQVSFFCLLLALALLPVLIPDSVYAFRIRDVVTASSEQGRSSCNPLLGKCTDQKISGISSTIRLRRRFEGSNTPQPRTAKIQPLVEESSQVDDHDGRLASSSYVKSKSDSLKLQLRTSTSAKPTIGISARGSVKLKASFASSDEENVQNSEDEEDEAVEENEDDDSEENSEDDEDEDDISDSQDDDDQDDEVDIDKTDEEENKDETTESDDDENDEEDDDTEQEEIENERDVDSENEDPESAESVEESLTIIKLETKFVKRDVAGDKKTVKVVSTRDSRSTEKDVRKSLENVHEVTKIEISEEKDVKFALDDHVTGLPASKHDFEINKEEVVDRKLDTGSAHEKLSTINESDDKANDNDDDDVFETKVEVTLPPRKLEKVRLADKSRSMEVLRTRSLEESLEKIEPKKLEKEASKNEKIEAPKPTPPIAQMPESKQLPKLVEKTSASSITEEVKKSGVKEKKKAPQQPKKETKSPPKQSENSQVKKPEVNADRRSEKPKSKTKKKTEASITLSELNDLLLHVPSFTPNFTAIKDSLCQQHGKIFLRQLRGYKLWALQMLDSSAKIPSGLLRGNLNQLGDFDQCLSIRAHVKVDEKTVKVQGKYCLATLDLQATRNDMKIPVNMMQSRAFLRANMNEPKHFVPRFTTVNWALCVPAACSPEDVQSVIEDALSFYNGSMGLKFTVGIDADSCYVKQKAQPYSKETVAVLYFYAMTLCLVFVATLRDFCVTTDGPGSYSERIIMAFSLRRTTRTLLQDSESSGDIRCIHGIRSIATILLYVAHKLIPIARLPFANRISLTEVANNPLSSILRVSLVYTDSFLLLSGALTAYHMAKEFNNRGEIRWFCRFVTRFIRLTPALLAVVFWYAFVMEHVGSGPQWNSVINSNAELCKKNAWTNLLYIQNFFPFEEMCATHTHQLALDMQLSLLAPMLVFFLCCKPIIGILVILFLLQVSATVRYLATMNNYLSVVIFHGMTVKHLYKTANMTYALPLHRATPYLFGVALGVLMRYTGKQLRMHRVLVIIGWLLAAVSGSWSLLSPWRLARRDYTYDVEEATYYAVILPVCWSASLFWIIFASFTHHGGVVNKFLSNYWLVVFSRLSYSVYLTQFAIFFYNVGTTRYTSEFQVHRSVDLYEAATVVAISIVLTLLLDLPMQEVKNVIMECTDGLTIEEVSSEESDKKLMTESEDQMAEEPPEKRKLFVDEAVESSGWDWAEDAASNRKIKTGQYDGEEPSEIWTYRNDDDRKKSLARRDAEDEEMPTWDWIKTPVRKVSRHSNDEDRYFRMERRSQSRQEISGNGYGDDSKNLKRSSGQQMWEDDGPRVRDQRSQSRASDGKRLSAKDQEELSWDARKSNDSSSRAGDNRRSNARDIDGMTSEFSGRERSLARETENVVSSIRKGAEEQPSWEYVKRERSASQSAKDGKKLSFEGLDGQPTALKLSTRSLPRASEFRKRVSSESEEEVNRREKPEPGKIMSAEEPRVSDEESWEHELRLRRQRMANSSQHSGRTGTGTGTASEEEEWNILKRRSSAEGKMALLNDSPEMEHFGAWSISKVPDQRPFQHEHSESDEENAYVVSRNNYRETQPPFREGYDTQSEEEPSWDPSRQQSYASGSQPTFIDEEENPSAYDFVLRKGSKRTSLQNLSKISQEEPDGEDDPGWDFVKEENTDSSSGHTTSTGLFKRASIIKSQASEEDPEYLLPERPKLVEQEQEHPFKKAWQMQKSRSEEDGPSGFLVKDKDGKPRTVGNEGRKDASQQEEDKRKPSGGGQAEDLSYFGGDEAESTSVSYPASNSGDSTNADWIEDDEKSGASALEETELESTEGADNEKEFAQDAARTKEQKRHSEESNWDWNQEET